MSVVRMVRLVVPLMRAAGGGSIVNVTGLSVIQPMVGFGLSVATWAGVIGLAKTLSLELAGDGITINTICPGYINTTRLEKVFRKEAESAARTSARQLHHRYDHPDRRRPAPRRAVAAILHAMRVITALVLALLLGSAAVAADRETPVAVGQRAPDIALGDQYGKRLRLAEVLSQHDFVVVAFYVKAFTGG
jgi:NAD(P)-dependent dehydrogenase (short-subunit alcohol dehydrogenase family)